MKTELTLGPILFHWPAQTKLDFYARIADEAPIDTVYLGEVICSKRSPFFDKHYDEVVERLEKGGKKVVFSSLAEVMLKRERNMMAGLCTMTDHEIEVNDASALWHVSGKSHRIGPLMNVYNEETMAYLVGKGATHFSLPVELPGDSAALLVKRATELGATVEIQVFGRASLALSARCYHARAHGRIKDNCQFVCEEDPDGMPLDTLDGEKFLSINGIQTLSHTYINYIEELAGMREMGISHFRLVPHTQDMVAVAQIFRDVLDDTIDTKQAEMRMETLEFPAPFSNGFWHHQAGYKRVSAA